MFHNGGVYGQQWDCENSDMINIPRSLLCFISSQKKYLTTAEYCNVICREIQM